MIFLASLQGDKGVGDSAAPRLAKLLYSPHRHPIKSTAAFRKPILCAARLSTHISPFSTYLRKINHMPKTAQSEMEMLEVDHEKLFRFSTFQNRDLDIRGIIALKNSNPELYDDKIKALKKEKSNICQDRDEKRKYQNEPVDVEKKTNSGEVKMRTGAWNIYNEQDQRAKMFEHIIYILEHGKDIHRNELGDIWEKEVENAEFNLEEPLFPTHQEALLKATKELRNRIPTMHVVKSVATKTIGSSLRRKQ